MSIFAMHFKCYFMFICVHRKKNTKVQANTCVKQHIKTEMPDCQYTWRMHTPAMRPSLRFIVIITITMITLWLLTITLSTDHIVQLSHPQWFFHNYCHRYIANNRECTNANLVYTSASQQGMTLHRHQQLNQ